MEDPLAAVVVPRDVQDALRGGRRATLMQLPAEVAAAALLAQYARTGSASANVAQLSTVRTLCQRSARARQLKLKLRSMTCGQTYLLLHDQDRAEAYRSTAEGIEDDARAQAAIVAALDVALCLPADRPPVGVSAQGAAPTSAQESAPARTLNR